MLAGLAVPLGALFLVTIPQAHAEQPYLPALASRLYVTLPHGWIVPNPEYSGPLPTREGIWVLDPQRFEYARVAPLYLQHSCGIVECSAGASLTAVDNRLLVQAWPASLDFEISTMRLVRRYEALDTDLRSWYLYGAAVSAGSSASLGLAPGIYGHAVCGFDVVQGDLPYGECDPHQFPGAEEAAPYGDPRLVLHRPLVTDGGALSFGAHLASGLPESSAGRLPHNLAELRSRAARPVGCRSRHRRLLSRGGRKHWGREPCCEALSTADSRLLLTYLVVVLPPG
jgi:hypothetical protein